jgi:hypothetical protein
MHHVISTLLLSACLTLPAFANEEFTLPDVKTEQRDSSQHFWQNFWNVLLGKTPLETADLQVKVLAGNGTPLRGATVLVGAKKGVPFATNEVVTDAAGIANFSDEKIRSGQSLPVTISLNGYSTLTLVGNSQSAVEVKMQKLPGEQDFGFLAGKVTGFPTGYDSGTLEMGVFMPAFQPETLLNFDPQQFISSYKVKINVFGEREVPGNVVLPTQRKRYGIIPISISKPDFQMPLAKGLSAQMLALAGAVDIGDAMDAVKNKDFLTIINMASFTHVGFTNRQVTVRGDEKFDLNLSYEIAPQVAVAQMASVPAKTDAVAVSLVNVSGGGSDLIPMDVKSLKSEEFSRGAGAVKLGALKQKKAQDQYFAFTGLFDRVQLLDEKANSRWLVGSLQPMNAKLNAQFRAFLKPIQAVAVSANKRDYTFTSAANGAQGVRPSLLIFNLVSEKKNALTQGKTRHVLWTTLVKGDAAQVSLPDLGKPVLPAPDTAKDEKFLWEVIAVVGESNLPSQDFQLQTELKNVQHVSTFSQKF